MKRYLSSFFIAFFSYVFLGLIIFYLFKENIIVQKEEKKEIKTISLNHIELKPQIQEKPTEILKEELPVEEIKKELEIQKPIENKPIENKITERKKEKPKQKIEKKITESKIVEKHIEKNKENIIKENIQSPKVEKEIVEQKQPIIDETKDYLDKHLAQIRNSINQSIKYPQKAKKLSIEGIVIVKFRITEKGTVENILIIDGHKFLQNSTIEAIEEASKSFPKINKSIEIQIPIEYKLI